MQKKMSDIHWNLVISSSSYREGPWKCSGLEVAALEAVLLGEDCREKRDCTPWVWGGAGGKKKNIRDLAE